MVWLRNIMNLTNCYELFTMKRNTAETHSLLLIYQRDAYIRHRVGLCREC